MYKYISTFTKKQMTKRKSVDTSLEAYASLDPNQLVGLRKKIYLALVGIKEGHYEDIALACRIKPVQVWKRLSELHDDGLIHRTGQRKLLSSNRMGFVWAPGKPSENIKRKEKPIPGKTVADHSRAIKKIQKQTLSEVKSLF